MINKLVCFDFDFTLVFTPEMEEGKALYELKTGKPWPYSGFWGRKESLDLNIFDIPINDWTYPYYLKYISDPEAYVFMATGRIRRMEKEVHQILHHHKFKFDDIYLTPNGGNTYEFKKGLFERKIAENPHADEFIMFDDRQEHIHNGFIPWAKNQSIKVTIYDALNKVEIFKNYK